MRFVQKISLLLLIFIVAACASNAPAATETAPGAASESLPTPTLLSEIDDALSGEETLLETAVSESENPEPTSAAPPTEIPPTPTPLSPTAVPLAINGMGIDQFVFMDDAVKQNIREIYARGQEMGRNRNKLSILGDSLIATPQSVAHWDGDTYVLGPEFAHLQDSIDHFVGSFNDYGVSVRVGLHSWSVFDPLWADKEFCEANEDLLTCEIRLNNPGVMIIFLGSNDAGSPGGFDVNYRKIVEELSNQGIVPILATKADRFEGPDNVNNTIIRQIAADYQVPLLEFDILADTIPGRGLGPDNVHLTYSEPYDYTQADTFTFGYPVHNLAVLATLDRVLHELN